MLTGRFTTLPHVPRASAFLDSRQMIRNPVSVFEKYRKELGPTFSFHFGGARRSVVTTDPEIIAQVLLHNRERYQKSDIQAERMVEFQGEGLVNIHGEAWRRQRLLVAQGFRRRRLANLLPLQIELLEDLLVGFDRAAAAGPVDVHTHMVRLTLGLVGKSIFGRAMTDAELAQIGYTISEIQGFIVRQIVQPYLIPWFRISGESEKYQALRRSADAVVLRHIQERRSEGTGALDFLRVLIDTPYADTGEPMTEAQVLVEALQLMVAGNETSSNGLTWTLYLLGEHPEWVERIREEAEAVLGDGPADFAALHRLELTQRVIHEALRLYPPFWMIDRIAMEDDTLGGVHIPAGTLVIPYLYGTHRNPAHWSDVEAFDPDRFTKDARKGLHKFAYVPFGGGPRICVGNNMALMQMLLIIATLVRRYDISAADEAQVGIRPMMLLRPDGAVDLTFRRRG